MTKNQLIKILEHVNVFFQKNDCLCLSLKRKDVWYHIHLRNTINLESRTHKVILNMVNHGGIEVYGKLYWFEEEIQKDLCFVRIHKSTIVNGSYINRFSASEAELIDEKIYPISRIGKVKCN